MKHRIAPLALAALLLLCLSVPAAADTGYTGVIDPETGDPYTGESVQSGSGRAKLSDSMYYDWSAHDFAYPVEGTLGEVHVTAADGMVLTTPVSIAQWSEAVAVVYRNGSQYSGDITNCNQAGDYMVSALVNGQTKRLMGFTLVGQTTNAVHTFVAPDGFYILSAERDGENIYLDRYSVPMEEEGEYSIEYECSPTNIVYKLETTIDRTPPSLFFQGKADREGRIRSKLEFSGLMSGDTIWLTRSGETVEPELNGDGTGTIYDPGNYVMIVTDAAGNSIEYDFIILQYLNTQSWMFFLAVILVIAAVTVYILLQRKRLKIG